MYNKIDKLASAIHNNVVGGLRGYHQNLSLSTEQISDAIINERMQILKEYSLKGILPVKDLYISINCIQVDCKDLERCNLCNKDTQFDCLTPTAHFEVPQIMNDYGAQSIGYIGSSDRQNSFIVYTSPTVFTYHKYRKRGKNKPYVWIDTTPNENGMYDGFIFNAPLISEISITAIFKDLRQLEKFQCCSELNDDNITFIDNEIERRLTEKYIRYYRALSPQSLPNDQQYVQG